MAANDEEAKHLARVINSFRNMELHTSTSPGIHAAVSPSTRQPSKAVISSHVSPGARSAKGPSRGSSGNLPVATALSNEGDGLGLPPRPSSCAGTTTKRAGRFHELKGEQEGVKNGVRPTIALPAVVTDVLSGGLTGSQGVKRSCNAGDPRNDVELARGSKVTRITYILCLRSVSSDVYFTYVHKSWIFKRCRQTGFYIRV